MLGLDPLTVANEGKMIFAISPETADQALQIIRNHPLGKQAAIIATADQRTGRVRMKTRIGGERIIDTPYGRELPRIC
jgi:hydrogenase expression/formation protein HypE